MPTHYNAGSTATTVSLINQRMATLSGAGHTLDQRSIKSHTNEGYIIYLLFVCTLKFS
jgi:hypothetical protein